MFKILRFIFAIISIILATYAIISANSSVIPFMIFSLGVMFLFMGISELQEKRKAYAYTSFIVSALDIFISLYTFFF